MLISQTSARKAWPWPWFWTQTMNVTRLTLDYFNCLTSNWWKKTLRWHVRHCYITSYGTFLKKINDLQNQGHVTPKSNFPSWNHGKSYSTMLPVYNDTKFMLVTRNANDFLLEDISNLTKVHYNSHHHQINVHFLPKLIKGMVGCFPTAYKVDNQPLATVWICCLVIVMLPFWENPV